MNLLSELRADALSAKLLPALVVGSIMGAVLVLHGLALATIVFSGPLSPFTFKGGGMILFGGVVFCLVIALTSGYRGAVSCPQEIPAVVLATVGAAVAAGMVGARPEALFMTMAALLIVTGVVTGLCFLAVGHLRLANLCRYVPYPVAGGFFAGTGWFLCLAALSAMSGLTPEWQTLPRLFEPSTLWKWGPGVAFGLVLVFIMKRWNSFPIAVAGLVLAAGLYHLGLVLLDVSVEEAKAAGLLLSGMAEETLWPAFGFGDLRHVDWNVVARQAPGILTVTTMTLLCLLIHLNGLELATGVEVDLDKEFGSAGLAGMFAGVSGSPPGCHTFACSLSSWLFGADTRLTGVVAAFVVGFTLFFGGGMLAVLPAPVIGALLFFLGFDLLNNWLVDVRKRLHWADYGIVVLMFVTIAIFGFVAGVGIGLVATTAFFSIHLSRTNVIEASLTGRELRSNTIRSIPDRAILMDHGERLRVYRLRGFIFFGSVHALVDSIKQSLSDTPPPAFVLLDCTAVFGFDFSAVSALCGFIRSADSSGARVAISAAPERFEGNLRRNLPADLQGKLLFEADLDQGLERGEDLLIAMAGMDSSGAEENRPNHLLERVADDMEHHLDKQIFFEEMVGELEPWLERREYETGETLAARGEAQEGLQLLVSGRASVHDAEGTRLLQYGPGDAIEPRAAFGAHSASASTIAQESCRIMMLTPMGRRRLESDEPELSLKLYGFLISHRIAGEWSPHID